MKISILIPTLDNLEYTKFLVDSIEKNTVVDHEVLIHQNTVDNNLGLPKALNMLGRQATGDYICYLNDDMWVGPGWDEALLAAVNPDIYYQYLTALMIEPQYENACMNSPWDFGRTPKDFDAAGLLQKWKVDRKMHDVVSPYCPIFVTKALWDHVGGYDESYFPCFGTDPDFAAKIYFAAATDSFSPAPYEFRAVADCCVYHFQCITTDKIPDNAHHREKAKETFMRKWKMPWGALYNGILHVGDRLS